jgi:MFS family permease
LAGLFSFVSVIGSASVNKWEHLLVFRILLGAGMAGKASIVPILLSETSPKDVRGFLLVFWQLFVAFGLAVGSVANLSVYGLNIHSSWRYMFTAAFIPALLLLSLILFSPGKWYPHTYAAVSCVY